VWVRTHLVRNRPVMKPPNPDETHCTTISQIPAAMVKVVADAPAFGHADAMARPNPEPINSRTREVEAAASPPPKMAGQEIADTDDSVATP
jgi:hypothetical protein